MTNSEARKRLTNDAPVDSGAIGRLNEAERADFLANLRQNLGYRAWVIEDTMLGHVEHLVREHTDRALAEAWDEGYEKALWAIDRGMTPYEGMANPYRADRIEKGDV